MRMMSRYEVSGSAIQKGHMLRISQEYRHLRRCMTTRNCEGLRKNPAINNLALHNKEN
jgi:hypothetical protein